MLHPNKVYAASMPGKSFCEFVAANAPEALAKISNWLDDGLVVQQVSHEQLAQELRAKIAARCAARGLRAAS